MGVAGLPAGWQLVSGLHQLQNWSGEPDSLNEVFYAVAKELEVHSDLSASEDYRRKLIVKLSTEVCISAHERALKLL